MNYIWGAMILISLICAGINGTIPETVNAGFDGAKSSVEVVLGFAGVMCLWTGLFKAADRAGIAGSVQKFLSPITGFLFPRLEKKGEAMKYITLNMTANLLGMGNGATPMGIQAMKELDRDNPDRATDEMCMFTVINTAAFQLVPTTILALRAGAGSKDPFSVIVPIWIASLCALAAGVMSVKVMCLFGRGVKKDPRDRAGGFRKSVRRDTKKKRTIT